MFQVLVTVTPKNSAIPLWNKVAMNLDGSKNDLKNVIAQFQLVKDDVNTMVANKHNIKLRDLDITFDYPTPNRRTP